MTDKNCSAVSPNTFGDILDERDVAALLKVQPRTIRLWRERLGLPYFKITAKAIRFRRADIDDWLVRRVVRTAA